jgi:DNA polymerase-3 subunit delta'
MQETLDLWLGWWRDVMLLAADADASLTNVDRESEARNQARRCGLGRSKTMVEALRSAIDRLRRNANPRLTLEVLMLDLPRA